MLGSETASDSETITALAEERSAPPPESSRTTEFSANELAKKIANEPESLAARLGPIVAEKVFPEIDGVTTEHSIFADGSLLTPTTRTFYRPTFAVGNKHREILATRIGELQKRIKSPDSDALSVKLDLDVETAERYHVTHGRVGAATVDEEEISAGGLRIVTPRKDSLTGTDREPEPGSPRARSNSNLSRERWVDSRRMRPGGQVDPVAPAGPADAETYSGFLALESSPYNRVDGRLTVPLEVELLTMPSQIFLENDGVDPNKTLLETYLHPINPSLTAFLKRETDGQRSGFVKPDQTLLGGKFFDNFEVMVLSPGLVVLKDRRNPNDPESVVVLTQKPKSGDSWWHVDRFHLTDDDSAGIKINNWLLDLEGKPANQ